MSCGRTVDSERNGDGRASGSVLSYDGPFPRVLKHGRDDDQGLRTILLHHNLVVVVANNLLS